MLYKFQSINAEGRPSHWSAAYSFSSADAFKEYLDNRFPSGQQFEVRECTPIERAEWLVANHNERFHLTLSPVAALDHIKLLCGPNSEEAVAYAAYLRMLAAGTLPAK